MDFSSAYLNTNLTGAGTSWTQQPPVNNGNQMQTFGMNVVSGNQNVNPPVVDYTQNYVFDGKGNLVGIDGVNGPATAGALQPAVGPQNVDPDFSKMCYDKAKSYNERGLGATKDPKGILNDEEVTVGRYLYTAA